MAFDPIFTLYLQDKLYPNELLRNREINITTICRTRHRISVHHSQRRRGKRFSPHVSIKGHRRSKTYLHEKHTAINSGKTLFYYAICLKGNNIPIGYIHVSGGDSYDLGYGLRKEFWHKGICSEACRVVIEKLKHIEIPYITATHDVNNPRSGRVMQAIGMKYRYSYNELWQPKTNGLHFECINSTQTVKKIEFIKNTGTNILSILQKQSLNNTPIIQ